MVASGIVLASVSSGYLRLVQFLEGTCPGGVPASVQPSYDLINNDVLAHVRHTSVRFSMGSSSMHDWFWQRVQCRFSVGVASIVH